MTEYSIDRHGIDPAQPRKRYYRVWRGPDLVADSFVDRYAAQRWIKSDKVMPVLPKRQGDYAVYESKSGVRFHIETSSQKSLYGVENVTEGVSLRPRNVGELRCFIAERKLAFVELGR